MTHLLLEAYGVDKTVPDGLIYHNLGSFFASRGIGMILLEVVIV